VVKGTEYTLQDVLYIQMHNGRSIIRAQADTFGKNQAINRYGASFFRNGAIPTLVIRNPNKFKDEDAFDLFRKRWEDTYGSARNGNRTAILDDGKTIEKISLSNEDSQFLDTSKYSDSQIAGLFRVPVYMIGNYDKATFSNIENLGSQFARFTMAPWCRRVETALSAQCLTDKSLYVEFLMDSLERGNLLDRYSAYRTGRESGFLSANEIRQRENLDPYDGGDIFLQPLNHEQAGKGGEDA
jgi:HK97 family phage portal protein